MIPHGAIRSATRKLWLWSPQRREAKKAAKLSPGIYLCASCQRATKDKDTEIDHVVPIGPTPGSRNARNVTWDQWLARLFCPADGLRVLCRGCHDERTKASPKTPSIPSDYKPLEGP